MICNGCGERLFIGDEYYHFPGKDENYHFECVPDELEYRGIVCEKREREE